jgi:hypothetical protein
MMPILAILLSHLNLYVYRWREAIPILHGGVDERRNNEKAIVLKIAHGSTLH